MTLRLCMLGSGSEGNCAYISDGDSALLLDAGFSAREIRRRMAAANLDQNAIRGIVVSHEHSDHTRGVGPLARALDVPVYLNAPTYERIKNVVGRLRAVELFEAGDCFTLAGIEVTPFSIPHDGEDPCAFVFARDGRRLGVVTDTGYVTTLIEESVRGIDYLVIEANHDPAMLQAGPYPWYLKQRIASRDGHLSNEACVELLGAVAHPGLQGVTFAHLSKTNNNADLVRLMAADVLAGTGTPFAVASQDEPGEQVTIE